ncbi:acyltransferase [Marinilongibacter aquaticus]|uniref:acyltransferase family protein n=1 Tax=Marinilongibacter aquaticus TaxID=2975157 RepID=UPI0021BD5FC2|nr:acyltransferase [Marinilongibacter aquaticus]UBM57574.1 acyltransferase [Marinilongibacter aquaticus]
MALKEYIPALTGIRALAIAMVLVFHWLPADHPVNCIPNGPIGVTIFFTLSGFLITRILSRKLDKPIGQTYSNFIVRRALRIFPIYFLVLLVVDVLYFFSIQIETDFYAYPWYYYGYAYNVLLERTANWKDYLSPYWSLAVEEQFYVIWGIVVLCFQKEKVRRNLYIITILLGMLSRYFFIYAENGVGVLTVTCMDCFAWGALVHHLGHKPLARKSLGLLFVLSLLGLLFIFGMDLPDSNLFKIIFFRSFVSIVSAFLINQIVENREGILSNVLGQKFFVRIGNISYGLYVYHMTVPVLFLELVEALQMGHFRLWHMPLFEQLLVVAVSILSWYAIEKPVNALKNKFRI